MRDAVLYMWRRDRKLGCDEEDDEKRHGGWEQKFIHIIVLTVLLNAFACMYYTSVYSCDDVRPGDYSGVSIPTTFAAAGS